MTQSNLIQNVVLSKKNKENSWSINALQQNHTLLLNVFSITLVFWQVFFRLCHIQKDKQIIINIFSCYI